MTVSQAFTAAVADAMATHGLTEPQARIYAVLVNAGCSHAVAIAKAIRGNYNPYQEGR